MKKDTVLNDKTEQKLVWRRSLITGFVGGFIFSVLGIIAYYFNLSEVDPKTYIIESWIHSKWARKWQGDVLAIFLASLLSLIVSSIYYSLFRKINSIWMGFIYGLVFWLLTFFILQRIIPDVKSAFNYNEYTYVTTVCLYILYGVFIGYSISYDYKDTLLRMRKR